MTRDPKLLLALGITGASALALEVIWSRALIPWVGGTAMAQVATVGVYMFGLFAGSAVASRLLASIRNPRKWFLIIEAAAAIISILMILGIPLADPLFRLFSQGQLLSGGLGSGLRGLAGGSLIFPATFLMGMGFPMAIKSFQDRGMGASSTAWVYGVNTVGAALGTVLGGFVLVPKLGILWGSMLVVGVDLLVLYWAGQGSRDLKTFRNVEKIETEEKSTGSSSIEQVHSYEQLAMIIAVFVGGFVALGLEVVLFRVLGLILGPTVRAFTVVVGSYVLGLGLGSLFVGRVVRKGTGMSRAVFMLAWILAGVLVYLIHLGLNVLPGTKATEFLAQSSSFGIQVMAKGLVAAALLLPLTAAFGAAYAAAVGAADSGSAQRAGRLYAALALGNVLGLVTTAVWILPVLGPEGGMVALGSAALVVPLFAIVGSGYNFRVIAGMTAGIGLLACILPQSVQVWNWMQLVSGPYMYGPKNLKDSGKYFLFLKHSSESTISVIKEKEATFFSVDGKVDGSNTRGDMATQSMLGILGPLLHPDPKKALVIGLGTGQTVSEILRFPLDRVDCAEISPVVKEILPFFESINRKFWTDPRFNLLQADGRTVLRYGPQDYDIIVSEPSNVWVPGVAQLFTKEAFAEARDSLRGPSGIFCQWLHAYRLHPEGFKMVLRAFLDSFPYVSLWTTAMSNHDVLLVGSLEPLDFSQQQLDRRLNEVQVPNYRIRGEILDSASFLRTFVGQGNTLRISIGPGPVASQGRPRLEYLAEESILKYHTGFFEQWLMDIGVSAGELLQGKMTKEFEQVLADRAEGNRLIRKLYLQGRGWTGFASRKAEGSLAELERLNKKFPEDLEFHKVLADFPFSLGESMYSNNDKVKAEKFFNITLGLWPKHEKALKNLAIIAMQRGDYGNALNIHQKYEDVHPGPMAKLLEADIYRAQRLVRKAIPIYHAALKEDPLSLHARGALASCFAIIGLPHEALIMFKEVLEMDPENLFANKYVASVQQR